MMDAALGSSEDATVCDEEWDEEEYEVYAEGRGSVKECCECVESARGTDDGKDCECEKDVA